MDALAVEVLLSHLFYNILSSSALFLDFEEDWRKKEASYVQTIQELKTAVGKTETEKIEEMKRDVGLFNKTYNPIDAARFAVFKYLITHL